MIDVDMRGEYAWFGQKFGMTVTECEYGRKDIINYENSELGVQHSGIYRSVCRSYNN